jgi:hypothetical protein
VLLSEGVVKIVKLCGFIWTRVATCRLISPNFVFDVSVCPALSFWLSKHLKLWILFVLLVALLFSLLKVIMTSVLLLNLSAFKLRRLSQLRHLNFFSFEFLISLLPNISVSLIYDVYLLIQIGIYLINLRLSRN